MNDDESVDMSTTKNIKWVAKLGSQAYGNVTIANGRVFAGITTNPLVIRVRRVIVGGYVLQ